MNRKLNICTFLVLVSALACAQNPQKFDSLYKTIYAKDLCQLLEAHPSIVLVDVRTPGEFNDSSQRTALNMGHLKGAVNLHIDSIQKNNNVMEQFRDKTLVIYCSHSQRSRRVSKLLSEKGFTDFYNLNGGMSNLNQMSDKQFPCKEDWIVSSLGYKNLSNAAAAEMIATDKRLLVLNVRPTAQFNGTDSAMENNLGKIKGAISIPYADLAKKAAELQKYKEQPLLVYAASGDGNAAKAAAYLVSNGFKQVYHLLAGLNDLVASQPGQGLIETAMPFRLINSEGALDLLKKEQQIVIYDTRPETEFENRDKTSWLNLGRIRHAINLRENDFKNMQPRAGKEQPVLIYGHGEAYKLAHQLGSKGYTRVYLMEGLYDFFWSSFNVEACREARLFLVNHEGIY